MSDKPPRKVFVVNRSGHDFAAAERFGTLRFVTKGNLDRFAVNDMLRDSVTAFEDANEDDYILITGLTVLCSVVCATFARKFGRLNLLLYRGGEYFERNIIIDNML